MITLPSREQLSAALLKKEIKLVNQSNYGLTANVFGI